MRYWRAPLRLPSSSRACTRADFTPGAMNQRGVAERLLKISMRWQPRTRPTNAVCCTPVTSSHATESRSLAEPVGDGDAVRAQVTPVHTKPGGQPTPSELQGVDRGHDRCRDNGIVVDCGRVDDSGDEQGDPKEQ